MKTLTHPLTTFVLGCVVAVAGTSLARTSPVPSPAATVLPLEATEVRVHPEGSGSIRFLARGRRAFVGLLQMNAGGGVPKHRDATEEYIHILEGGGTITIDGKEHRVTPGTTIFMPANAEVSFVNSDKPLKALQVFAGPGPADKYKAWKSVKATNPAREGRPPRRGR